MSSLHKNRNRTIKYRELLQIQQTANICGAHSGVAKDSSLLRCCTVLTVKATDVSEAYHGISLLRNISKYLPIGTA